MADDFVVLTDEEANEFVDLLGIELGVPIVEVPQRYIAIGAFKAMVHVFQANGWKLERPEHTQ